MSEARSVRDFGYERFLAAATVDAYGVIQTPTGKAGVHDNPLSVPSGEYADVRTAGTFIIAKATGFVALKGGRAYWDHSANNITWRKVNDRDFYVGRFTQDELSGSNQCSVALNEDPPYDIDIKRDGFLSVPVGTQAVGAFGYPKQLGGSWLLELTATNEAQKIDILSVDGFAKSANAIIRAVFRIPNDGSNATQDFNIGVANGTHATDADSITESVFCHIDGNSTNIAIESDDGTTEVAATDSLSDYMEGSAVANRVEIWIDMRDPADVQVYVNGSNVLPSSVFNVDAATGPFFLLAHLEKSSSTDVFQVVVDELQAWFAEQ